MALSRAAARDLARGAVDAWLHPPVPSRAPAIAAITGGALWTATAVVLAQDPLPDWPGYTMDALPLAIAATATLAVAIGGAWLRLGDRASVLERTIGGVAVAAHVGWLLALLAMLMGGDAAALTGATSGVAAVATSAVALLLVRRGDGLIAAFLAAAPIALAFSASRGWLFYGLAWTVVGLVQWPRSSGSEARATHAPPTDDRAG